MVTLLISGSDTGIGKTRVCAALARVAARSGRSVEVVKPVQCGAAPGHPTDADEAARLAELPAGCAHTLQRFRAPLAPLAAASAEGAVFQPIDFTHQLIQVPSSDIRLLEGVGGLAVPLTADGLDFSQITRLLSVDAVVLVVPDRLGAINQARLVYHYFRCSNPHDPPCGIFFNAVTPPAPEVAASNRAALASCKIPLWGELAVDSLDPILHPPLAQWLGL